jgi:arginyl-tRNA synthetase
MQKLGRPYANGIYHLSYGMVELPNGKMKSREGTVVDADDLMEEMELTAKERTMALGKTDGFTEEEANKLYHALSLGALKYYLLKVDPVKTMLFNPEESIDFQGNTGVYIQYNHAKINAITRKAKQEGIGFTPSHYAGVSSIAVSEAEVVNLVGIFPYKVQEAAESYSPSIVANYVYELSKAYSKFYSELSIFGEEDAQKKAFRIALSEQTSRVIKQALHLLGIEAPERM